MNALQGLKKVLDLGQLIAGPFAGKTLADLGADVIKVEPLATGDPLRKWPAPPHRPARRGAGARRCLAGRHAVGAARRDRCADGAAPPNGAGRRGQFIDVALCESVFNVMESLLPEYDAFAAVRQRAGSALPGIAPKLSAAPRAITHPAPHLGQHDADLSGSGRPPRRG